MIYLNVFRLKPDEGRRRDALIGGKVPMGAPGSARIGQRSLRGQSGVDRGFGAKSWVAVADDSLFGCARVSINVNK